MFHVFVDRIIACLPAIQPFFAKKAYGIVGTVGTRSEYKSGPGKLQKRLVSIPSRRWLTKSQARTLEAEICLWGQFRALAARPPVVDPRFLVVFWKEAKRAS